MSDHRIIGQNGSRLPYTCENHSFKTNTNMGFPHGQLSPTLGSVFDQPLLIAASDYSLWLEHVLDKSNQDQLYWLMWYNPEGKPTIPLSGVFARNDLQQMLARLASFVP